MSNGIMFHVEHVPGVVVNESQFPAFGCEAHVSVVLTKENAVFSAAGEHAVGFVRPFGDEVVDEHADIGLVTPQREWGIPLDVEVCVDSCDETLAGGLLVSCCAIDLACEVEFAEVFCFEGVMELSWWKEVVFDGIAWPEHAGVFQAGYLAHRLELGFFGQGCGKSIEVGLDGVPPFRLDEDLVAILVRKPVDFVLNARTVAWPLSSDGARKQWAVFEAVLQDVVYGRVGVRDVTGMLVRQV